MMANPTMAGAPTLEGPVVETVTIRAGSPCKHWLSAPDGRLIHQEAKYCLLCYGTGRLSVNIRLRKHAKVPGKQRAVTEFQFIDGRGPGSLYEDLPSGQRKADPVYGPGWGKRAYEAKQPPRIVA